jgi:hypothetical protein
VNHVGFIILIRSYLSQHRLFNPSVTPTGLITFYIVVLCSYFLALVPGTDTDIIMLSAKFLSIRLPTSNEHKITEVVFLISKTDICTYTLPIKFILPYMFGRPPIIREYTQCVYLKHSKIRYIEKRKTLYIIVIAAAVIQYVKYNHCICTRITFYYV